MTKALLLAVSCAAALRTFAGELPTVPLFRYGITSDWIGIANIVPADLTGDGKLEIVSCSNGAPFALEHRSNDYPQRWYGPSVGCKAVTVGDTNGDGALDVIVAGDQGLMIFDPRSLGAARAKAAVAADGYDVAFGNVDFDAAPEIVVTDTSITYVYDALTLELQWQLPGHGGLFVAIADVDGDARNEIVTSGGSILDAGNEVLKWGYLGGFPQVAVGNVDADAKAEIVFAADWGTSATVLNGDTMTTSTVTGFGTIQQLAIGDADNDGVNEIIAGFDQWGSVRARRASDSSLAWNINNPGWDCMGIAVADVDNDGVREVLWGALGSMTGGPSLYVGNPLTQTVEWEGGDLDGPFTAAAGDLDGDGRAELVVLIGDAAGGYEAAGVKVLDARTGIEKLSIDVDYSNGYRLAIAQLDSDPAMEIAVNASGGIIRVFDGVTGAVEWTNPGEIQGMAIANVDADATDEIITYYDGKLIVMHGISNIIQSSRVFPGTLLTAGDVTGDGKAEVVIATNSALYLLSPTLATLRETALHVPVAATTSPVGGGTIAVLADFHRQLVLFDNTLTPQWTCALAGNDKYTAIAFGTIAGEPRLLSSDSTGLLRATPLGDEASCPSSDTRQTGVFSNLVSADVTGDGRADLVAGSSHAAEITLIGLPEEMRGDVNGDAVIAANDIDQLVDHLFGVTPGLSPSGDANADERLSGEDVFALIHHEFSGGSLP